MIEVILDGEETTEEPAPAETPAETPATDLLDGDGDEEKTEVAAE